LVDVEVRLFYRHVVDALPPASAPKRDPAVLTHAVVAALAERLSPAQARAMGRSLPRPIGALLKGANGSGRLLRDELIENVASRLDLDDDDAEGVALAVLRAVRQCLGGRLPVSQVLETLPADLQELMS
jgi:uncharacterized protein (DUF2267 family)